MKPIVTYLLALLLALTSTFSLARPAQAQPSDAELGEVAIFLTLFPQLRTLPAPVWFQPGARVTYRAISAIIGGGGAGDGLVQFDVVATGPTSFAQAVNYTDNGTGALIPLGASYSVGVPGVGQFWINPSVLVNAESVANSNLTISRTTRNINGTLVNVVRFQTDLNGARYVYEFSPTSGILVFSSISVPNPNTGTSQESQLIILNLRQLQLPWTGTRAPNWVRPGVFMQYTGQRTTTIPGAGSIPAPYVYTTQIFSATPTWSLLNTTEFVNGASTGSGISITGVGQLVSPFWLPREALNTNINAQVQIDQDPYTGIVLTIERADNGDIIIRQLAQGFQMAHRYHRTLGSLDSFFFSVNQLTSSSVTEVSRTGGSDLVAINDLPELDEDTPPEQDTLSERLNLPLVLP